MHRLGIQWTMNVKTGGKNRQVHLSIPGHIQENRCPSWVGVSHVPYSQFDFTTNTMHLKKKKNPRKEVQASIELISCVPPFVG